MDREARACRLYLSWHRCGAWALREQAGLRIRILRRHHTRGARA
jgi:hypothetical protein